MNNDITMERETDNRIGDNIETYLHDTAEEIQKCLNCKKRECDNCLGIAYKGVR